MAPPPQPITVLPYLLFFSLLMYVVFYAVSKINMWPSSIHAHSYFPIEIFWTLRFLCQGSSNSSRTRHIAIRYFFVKDRIDGGEVVMEHLGTSEMLADAFTKPSLISLFFSLLLVTTEGSAEQLVTNKRQATCVHARSRSLRFSPAEDAIERII
jgi:hypothetical protein